MEYKRWRNKVKGLLWTAFVPVIDILLKWLWSYMMNTSRSYICDPCELLSSHILAPFGLPYIRLVRLLFSTGTVFFSHNISARTVFSTTFRQVSASRTGPIHVFWIICPESDYAIFKFNSVFLLINTNRN